MRWDENENYLALVPAEDVCPFFAGVVLSIVKHQICELNKRTSGKEEIRRTCPTSIFLNLR